MRLKTVLKVKELEHEQLKLDLVAKNNELHNLNEKNFTIKTHIKKHIHLVNNNTCIADKIQISSILDKLKDTEKKIELLIKKKDEEIQNINESIKIKKQEIKSLEKLIENKLNKINKEFLRKEQNSLDELNIN